jgi:hypothetical protein
MAFAAPRLLILGALLPGALLGCGQEAADPAAPPAGVADVVVRVDRDGPGGRPPVARRVRCRADERSPACRALLAAGALGPVGADAVCTELYGGPQRARVTGTVAGRRVAASFSRADGCEIARWDRLAAVLVPGP